MEKLIQNNTHNTIHSRVLKTELINWIDLKFIQQEDFKEISHDSKSKLQASIVGNNFTQPFYVWRDENGVNWCLDGKHRVDILKELVSGGIHVPPYKLPATFIHCENKKEAAKLVLLFSSQYAKVTEKGFIDFIQFNDLDFDAISPEIDIQKFDLIEGVLTRAENKAVEFNESKQFFINIKCESEKHAEELYETLLSQGLDVKIVT